MTLYSKILLVDDDPINNLINKRLLEKVELADSIEEYLDGEAALKRIQHLPSKEVSLILLDINMPVTNGWEFLDIYTEVFSERNDIIIILSSTIDFSDRMKAKDYPIVSGFFEKPLSVDKIIQFIQSLL